MTRNKRIVGEEEGMAEREEHVIAASTVAENLGVNVPEIDVQDFGEQLLTVAPSWPLDFAAHGQPQPVCGRCRKPFEDGDELSYYAAHPSDNHQHAAKVDGGPYESYVTVAHAGCA